MMGNVKHLAHLLHCGTCRRAAAREREAREHLDVNFHAHLAAQARAAHPQRTGTNFISQVIAIRAPYSPLLAEERCRHCGLYRGQHPFADDQDECDEQVCPGTSGLSLFEATT